MRPTFLHVRMRGPLIPAECNHSYTQVSDSTPLALPCVHSFPFSLPSNGSTSSRGLVTNTREVPRLSHSQVNVGDSLTLSP